MRQRRHRAALAVLLLLLAGCGGGITTPTPASAPTAVPAPRTVAPTPERLPPYQPPAATATRAALVGTPAISSPAANCPVTPYAAAPPTGSADDRAIAGIRTLGKWYGSDGLWAFPWLNGEPPGALYLDASSFHKVLWWREPGVQGAVTVTAHRLDGPTAPVDVNFAGYPSQQGQQPSGLAFPTPGCWEITGTAGGKQLTIVALVLPSPATPGSTPSRTASGQGGTPAPYPTPPLPAGCDETAIRGVVQDFIAAFNAGDQAGLARVFPARGSDGDHPWTGDPDQLRWFTLTHADPSTGVDALNLYTRETLLAYFASRHARHEQLRVVELVINPAGGGPTTAAINFRITRTADDLPETTFGGKGGVGCAQGRIFLWSQGGRSGGPATPTVPLP
jgi:hypothetical protein